MEYAYIAYTKEKKLIKGKVSASNEHDATRALNQSGYQVVNLRAESKFFNIEKFLARLSSVNQRDILLLSRQLALLIESGTDVVTALELLRNQMTNVTMATATADIVNELRNGKSLSAAFSKYPNIFPTMYCRAIAAGEQGGNLDAILKQMADFLERSMGTRKKIKSALAYPAGVLALSVVVVIILVTFVLPSFVTLFSSFGAKLPATTQALISIVDFFGSYGVYVLIIVVAAIIAGFVYIRTPAGKYAWDEVALKLPVLGPIILLNELSYCCQLMAILFKVGLPLPDIMALSIQSTTNGVVAKGLSEVRDELIRGEGISKPMSRRKIFLPLMVQMISVGEETGRLDATLNTVAESYEIDAEDRTKAAVGMIQPILTIVIGGVITFIAVSLVSAMYGIYGQIG